MQIHAARGRADSDGNDILLTPNEYSANSVYPASVNKRNGMTHS